MNVESKPWILFFEAYKGLYDHFVYTHVLEALSCFEGFFHVKGTPVNSISPK